MPAEEIKNRLRIILGEQLKFEGHFDLVMARLSELMQEHLLQWAEKCARRELDPDPSPADHHLLVFFFKPSVNNIRGILTKRKNSYFIALFLDKHKYYDLERRKLGF